MVAMTIQSMAQHFFTTEEQKRISDSVHRAELRTSGELVPMLVAESHSYPLAAIRGGTFVALLTALIGTPLVAGRFWLESNNLWVFLGLFLPVYLIVHYLIQTFPSLKRCFLFGSEMDEEVQNSAFAAFFTERLYKTKDANGILIFISLLEHRAWIIADSGISERIPQEQWQDAVAMITEGIREKKQCQALCDAISMIGDILEKEFPLQDDDLNELHDLIIR
jgi:putative membrane protein